MSVIHLKPIRANRVFAGFIVLLALLIQYNTVLAQESCGMQAFIDADSQYANTQESGTVFKKSWTLRNDGRCAWPRALALVLVSGDRMSGPSRMPLASVGPGKTLEITIDLQAPQKAGQYTGVWQLEAEGVRFGPSLRVGIAVLDRPATLVNPIPPNDHFPGTADGFTAPPPEIVTQYAEVATLILPGEYGNSQVVCEEGQATGGGWSLSYNYDGARVHHSVPFNNGWSVSAFNYDDEPATLYAFVRCLKNVQSVVFSVLEMVPAVNNNLSSHVTLCPAGSILTGGGISMLPNVGMLMWSNGSSPILNGWFGGVNNLDDVPHDLVVHAVCLLDPVVTRDKIVNDIQVSPSTPFLFSPGLGTVSCPDGSLASSGGVGTGSSNFYITIPLANGEGWMNLVANESEIDLTMSVTVNCLTFP